MWELLSKTWMNATRVALYTLCRETHKAKEAGNNNKLTAYNFYCHLLKKLLDFPAGFV